MKVCILTFAVTNNYGATLQCYALYKFIQQQGHDAFILNVPLKKAGSMRDKPSFIARLRYKWNKLRNVIPEDERYHRTPEERLKDKAYDAENMKLFDVFRSKYFKNITHEYVEEQDFEKDYPNADLYIVGSDQVWNLWVTNYQYPIFFFSFVRKGCRRISYAASMGGNSKFKFKTEEIDNISLLLSRFNAISVRDKTSLKILENNFNISAFQVLDPTFLIDSYDELLADSTLDASGCLFSFKFIINDKWVNVIKTMASDMNLAVRMDSCLIPIDGLPFHPLCSIQEWLRLIKTSEFVFTDSFHGMVFCILFKKQFIATPSYKGGEERYMDLASKLGLEDRIYTSVSDLLKAKAWKKKIDYDKVYALLESQREKSKKFLLSQL